MTSKTSEVEMVKPSFCHRAHPRSEQDGQDRQDGTLLPSWTRYGEVTAWDGCCDRSNFVDVLVEFSVYHSIIKSYLKCQ